MTSTTYPIEWDESTLPVSETVKEAEQKRLALGEKALRVDRRHRNLTADDWLEEGRWVRVKSSNVSSIMYDRKEKTLYVAFKTLNGPLAVYRYFDVPVMVAKHMFAADSMGKYVHRALRDKYPFHRVS